MYRILVVEDDATVRKLLTWSLAAEGHECVVAMTVAQGMEAASREKPDAALLDVNLPDGSGIDLCKSLKSNPRLRHIPVLILTGEASSVDDKVEGLEAGADDYILKPFSVQELVARLNGILRSGTRPSGR